MKTIQEILTEHYNNEEVLTESKPWRSGNIQLELGRTAIKGIDHYCFVLNKLKLMTLKPNFMLIASSIEPIKKKGGGTNGHIIVRSLADNIEYEPLYTGTCKAKTYFYGRPKSGRTMDWYFRMFESGFSLNNIKGVKFFDNATLDITAQSRDKKIKNDMGRIEKTRIIPVRIKRVS